MNFKPFSMSFLPLALCLASSGAHAYNYYACLGENLRWKSLPVHMRASDVSFPAGSWRDALTEVTGAWNGVPSGFSFTLGYNEPSVGRGNGENEIWFSSDSSVLSGSPAITYSWWDCIDYWIFGTDVEYTEADVIFDVAEAYTPSRATSSLWEYGGAYRSFQTTAMHEFGHALGLLHVNWLYNIMGTDWTHIHANGGWSTAYAGEDATTGTRILYGTAAREDLGVSQWKYLGTSGEYSTHQRTKLYNASGLMLLSFNDAGEPRYYVNRGQQVQFEVTLENNGSSYQSTSVGLYVSTNNLVTTVDTLVASGSATLSPDSPFVTRYILTIPSDLTSGANYWLGIIIDPSNSIAEFNESNNATYIPIRVN